jgi:8-oxo-dGTP diphosphatase
MVYDGDKVVAQIRKKNWAGIAFPGGHVEHGESFTDSVIREVYEETGLKIESPILCGIDNWMCDDGSRYVILLYKTNKFTGELRSSDEGEVFWTTLENFKTLELSKTMLDMLDVFFNDDLSEFCWYLDENNEWKFTLK